MTRIKKKFIENNAIDGSKVLFLNNESIRSRNAANSADVELMKLDGSDKLQMLVMPQVSSDPVDANDLVRKSHLDTELAAAAADLTTLEGRVQNIEDDYAQPGGLATLGMDGKIPSAQLPALALTDVHVVANIAARDALSVEEGDVAKVTDAGAGLPRTYIYDGSSWIEIESGSDVDSVNGYTGTVVLATSDVSESGATNRYYTPTRQTAIEAYADAAVLVEKNRAEAAEGAIQSELDTTQTGAGLNSGGSYSPHVGSNYISAATSLHDADSKLDTEIKSVADDLAQEILDRAADVDAEETRALAAEGIIASNLAQEILDRIADVNAEESARIAEDLTFLKLDGSRQMEGDLEFASTPGGESSAFATSVSYDNTQHTFLANPVRALGQTFLAASAMSLSKVNFRLKRDGSAAGTVNIIAQIVPYSGGTFGSVLATSTNSIDHNSLPNDPYGDAVAQLVSFNFSPVALSSGQTYAVVLAVQGGILNTSNFLTVNVKALKVVGTSYGSGSVIKIQDDTDYNAGPIVDTNYDLFMEVFESISAQSYQIKGIAAPTISSDAANKGYVDGLVDAEEAARIAAVSGLQSELDATQTGAGLGSGGSYTAPVGSNYLGAAVSLKDADSKLDNEIKSVADDLAQEILDRAADVDAEETRAMGVESGLQSELDTTQLGAGLGTNGSYSAPVSSNYLGSAVSLKDADSKLDTQIKSVADGLAQEILDRAADVDAEESRALAAEGVLSGRITALEGVAVQFSSEKFTLSSGDISNGYIDLAHAAVGNSMNAFVDRLAIFETDDYTLSVVGGVTRLTFAGSLITVGQEKLTAGDVVRVKYAYEVL